MTADGFQRPAAHLCYPTKSTWRWWTALIDALIFYMGATAIAWPIAELLAPPIARWVFNFTSPYDHSMAEYLFKWIFWQLTATWLMMRWVLWMGAWDEMFPLPRLSVGLRRVAALIVLALLAILACAFTIDSFYPEQALQDNAIFLYYMNSPMAPFMVVLGVFIAPVFEEFICRGFLQTALSRTRLGFWGAAIVVSILWSASHVYNPPGAVLVFLTGLVLSFVLQRTGSLLPCIITHGLINLIFLTIDAMYPN